MKIIKPYAEILKPTGYTIDDIYKFIELVGRTCYKSQDKITKDSANEFVNRMIKSGHGAMLEHGTMYLTIPNKNISRSLFIYNCEINPYSKVFKTDDNIYITTNYRVIIENDWNESLKYITAPSKFHERRTTVKFICDRGVSHEFVRHRVFSFAQESTRYCNYSKTKFGNELTFILPCWINENSETIENNETSDITFKTFLQKAEETYLALLKEGWTPQQARNVLPNSIKTELIMTGFDSDWKHFFELRSDGVTGAPHPQAKELADMVKDKFY